MATKHLVRSLVRLCILAGITVFYCGNLCQSVNAQQSAALPGRQVFDLPYKRLSVDSNVQIIDVTLNSIYHTRFALDTGSSLPVIAADTVASLHILTIPKEPLTEIMDGKPEILAPLLLTVPKLGFKIEPVVINRSHLTTLGPDIDGVLGIHALESFAVAFDFQRHMVTLVLKGNLSQSELSALGFDGATVLPLVQSIGVYSVQVQLSSGPRQTTTTLIVDSGSDLTYISNTSARVLGFEAKGKFHRQGFDPHGFQTSEAQATLGLGNTTLLNQAISFLDSEKAPVPAVLGLDILMRFRVLMDLPAGRMYLAPTIPSVLSVQVKPMTAVPSAKP